MAGLSIALVIFEIYKGTRGPSPLKRYRLVLRKNLVSIKGRIPLVRPLTALNKHILILTGKTRRSLSVKLVDEIASLGAGLMLGYALAFTLGEGIKITVGACGLANAAEFAAMISQCAEDWIDLTEGPTLSDYFIPSYVLGWILGLASF